MILNEVPKLTPSTHQVWFLYKCYNKVDWRERCETPAGKARLGDPARLPDRPRKASACSGNPLQIVQSIKKREANGAVSSSFSYAAKGGVTANNQ
ncbi:hypothetical protein AM232_20515 [Bacillus sp. FJAT-21352]|nr:hypothetical protein AM232_20515 [Bacillus sp. FJAT-21352]